MGADGVWEFVRSLRNASEIIRIVNRLETPSCSFIHGIAGHGLIHVEIPERCLNLYKKVLGIAAQVKGVATRQSGHTRFEDGLAGVAAIQTIQHIGGKCIGFSRCHGRLAGGFEGIDGGADSCREVGFGANVLQTSKKCQIIESETGLHDVDEIGVSRGRCALGGGREFSDAFLKYLQHFTDFMPNQLVLVKEGAGGFRQHLAFLDLGKLLNDVYRGEDE